MKNNIVVIIGYDHNKHSSKTIISPPNTLQKQ